MRISDWSSDVCSSDLRRRSPSTTSASCSAPRPGRHGPAWVGWGRAGAWLPFGGGPCDHQPLSRRHRKEAGPMTIAAILGSKGDTVYSIEGDRTVRDAVSMLAEYRIGALPVLREGKVARSEEHTSE